MQTINCTARCGAKMIRRAAVNHGKIYHKRNRLSHRTDGARLIKASHPHLCACCGLETDEMCLDRCWDCAKLTPVQWFVEVQ